MIARILIGLNSPEATEVAARYATEICQVQGSSLTAVTAVDIERLSNVGPLPIGAGEAARELREHRINLTREIVEKSIACCEQICRDAGVKLTLHHEDGDPFDLFMSFARYHDLMVFGLDEGLFEHGVIDDPPDELVRLIKEGVRPIFGVTDEYRPVTKILAAYSGSMESAHTLRHFLTLGLFPDAPMRVVTFDKKKDEAERLLADAAEFCRAHGRQVETEFVPKSPAKNLLPYADEHEFDMIVVGNSARRLLLRELFGETALHVIRTTDRPIFTSQ